MKKSITLGILFFLFFFKIEGQIIKVKNLELSRVIVIIKNLNTEGESDGPAITIELSIENDKNSIITLHPSLSKLILQFKYKNKIYSHEASSFSLVPFFEKKIISIKQKESFFVKFSDSILLGSDILNYKTRDIYDYSREMIQILPTLQVIYKENGKQIISNGVENVKISDYYIYTP